VARLHKVNLAVEALIAGAAVANGDFALIVPPGVLLDGFQEGLVCSW